jgi:hypothetical protein
MRKVTRRDNIISIISFFLIIAVISIYAYLHPSFDFKKNGKQTIAKIYDIRFLGKQGRYSIYYTYKINDEVFKQTTVMESLGIGLRTKLLHKYFPIIYNSQKPEVSTILITKYEFEEMGLIYPDSLYWVEENRYK